MEKPIEIKRRAQRFVQSGDVAAALEEYEKLARAEPTEPYHSVVIADLLFKKGQGPVAAQRYLAAVEGYERAGLYKNGIAVCKKMARLNLSQGVVYRRLADLHKLDGLLTEAALFYMQHADWAVRAGESADAAEALRAAYEAAPENVAALERLAEVHLANGENDHAKKALVDAAERYDGMGLLADAQRCRARLAQLDPAAHGPAAPLVAPPERSRRPVEPPGADTPVSIGPGPLELPAAEPALEAPALGERARFGLDGDLPLEGAAGGVTESAEVELRIPGLDQALERDEPEAGGSGGPRAAVSAAPEIEESLVMENAIESAIDVPSAPAAPPVLRLVPRAGEVLDEVEADDEDDAGEAPREYDLDAGEAAVEPLELAIAELEIATDDDGTVPADPAPLEIASDALDPDHPTQPGLQFEAPAAGSPTPEPEMADLFWSLMPDAMAHPETMRLLQQAQEDFRTGARERGVEHLLRTAEAHETAGSFEPAARIYRALHRVRSLTPAILILWFENARRRADLGEAARVASQMGEHAMETGERAFAREWFERALALDPNYPPPQRRLQELAREKGRPMTTVSGGGAKRAQAVTRPTDAETATAEGDRIEITYGYGDVQVGIGELVDRFRKGVQDQVSGDAESHYALGVSYLEMGLIDQAMESLRAAAESPELRGRATELVGRCLMDHGRFEEAASEFRAALEFPEVGRETGLGVRFELGLALEAGGRLDEALAEFERVYAAQPSYPDAALKIRVLRKALENE